MLKVRLLRSRFKISLFLVTAIILYNEFFNYAIQRWSKWSLLNCAYQHECVKVLLIADPQIIGEKYEFGFPVGTSARWDSDRYLAKTFRHALSFVQPDLIIFLGDLMDEGSVATDEQYSRYLNRFNTIFDIDGKTTVIFNPGDNDIGGENDLITDSKLQRYHDSFDQPNIVIYKNASIFKVNRLTYSVPRPEANDSAKGKNKVNIVVSHMPLLYQPNAFVKKVLRELRPNIIFSAHDHKSLHTSVNTVSNSENNYIQALMPPSGPVWRFPLSDTVVHEVMVPTCSYRMGTKDMGYGAAVIDNTGKELIYTVLWLPQRFPQLIVYAIMILLVVIHVSVKVCCSLCRCTRTFLNQRRQLVPWV